MTTILETNRLRFRTFTSEDAEHLYALDNDPEVMRWITGGTRAPMAYIRDEILPGFMRYDRPGLGVFAAEEKGRGSFIGWFSFRPSGTSGEAVLGYRLRRVAWGKGYATEGVRALLDKGFTQLGIRRVTATTYEMNLGSRRVMEKAGMRFVRSFRLTPEDLAGSDTSFNESAEVWDGDDVEYAIGKEEWEAQQTGFSHK